MYLGYCRPNINKLVKEVEDLLITLKNCTVEYNQLNLIEDIYSKLNQIMFQNSKLQAYYFISSNNNFINQEKAYFNKYSSKVGSIKARLYIEIYRLYISNKLKDSLGEQYLRIVYLTLKGLNKNNSHVKYKEQELCKKYSTLISNSSIDIDNNRFLITELKGLLYSQNREIRKQAFIKKMEFFNKNKKILDNLFTQLVDLRSNLALINGDKSYIEIAYRNLYKTDYTQKDVRKFRNIIKKYVTPLILELQEVQKQRLNLDVIEIYDEKFLFKKNININSINESDFKKNMGILLGDISPEINEIYSKMILNDSIHTKTQSGKASGAFCVYIEDLNIPFVISNNNGSYEDVINFIHEFGHGYQRYKSKDNKFPELQIPTTELGEVAAMGMEFFIWPYLDKILKENTPKFKYYHLYQAILFLPYSAAIDEFQEYIYKNPNATVSERDSKWREIEVSYQPWKKNHKNVIFSSTWQQQGHIYFTPFYYIDYAIAQINAIEFWSISRKDYKTAWNKYERLCCFGGSKTYKEVLKSLNLIDPFDEHLVSKLISEVKVYFTVLNNQIKE